MWRGKARSRRLLWNSFLTTDLTARVTELDLPVYICQGRYDLTASYSEARSYFQRIAAPVKGFYTFAGSAHSPLFEEPQKMRRILAEDVLAGAVALADRRTGGADIVARRPGFQERRTARKERKMTGTGKDWNAEWMRLSDERETPHDAAFWDRRAADFRGGDESSPYVAGFIARMRLLPGESVLDAGSGSGTLALPLARAGHPVCALDFSQGMLAVLRERAAAEGLSGVCTVLASWDDDWSACGVAPADVVVASRSLDVRDLRAAFAKLDALARRRVCVTVPADGLLYPGLLAHAAVGRPYRRRGDGTLAARVLADMGIRAEVDCLAHASVSHFESPEAALESLRRVIAPLEGEEERALERYVAGQLVQTIAGDGRRVWTLEPAIAVRWAFLSWDKGGRSG